MTGRSETVTITLPGLPPRSLGHNGRGHWSQRQRDFREWKEHAYWLLYDRIGVLHWQPLWPAARAQVTWRYCGNPPDPTGCIERLAPVWDAAEAARLIPNDRWLLGVEVTLERVPRRAEQAVVVTFERAEAG